MSKRMIYLEPGFFGFTRLGALNYFNGVEAVLRAGLEEVGMSAEIVGCSTQPTGSITTQARRLADEVIDSGGLSADEIHFVGHSTGGLNARLLVSPGVNVRGGRDEKRIGELTRSVITVATPHHGTPLANFFTSLNGRYLLQLLTILATSTEGRYSIFFASKVLGLLAKIDDPILRKHNLLDELSNRLFDRLTLDPKDPIWRFLKEVASDQGAIIQLTPEGIRLFNAATADRETVRYRCVITVAPPPRIFNQRYLHSLDRTLFYLIFNFLYAVTSREHRHYPYPICEDGEAAMRLFKTLPFEIDPKSNDGIVPTLSQRWGDPIDVVVSDHLDIVGQFRDKNEPFRDWLPAGTLFDGDRFEHVWGKIAAAIKSASHPTPSAKTPV